MFLLPAGRAEVGFYLSGSLATIAGFVTDEPQTIAGGANLVGTFDVSYMHGLPPFWVFGKEKAGEGALPGGGKRAPPPGEMVEQWVG